MGCTAVIACDRQRCDPAERYSCESGLVQLGANDGCLKVECRQTRAFLDAELYRL